MTAAPTERPTAPVPVLDVGGTHVTAALVDPATGLPVPSSVLRRPLGSHADADGILDDIAATALRLPAGHGPSWGVAMPGPFDYATGIGRFTGIGKFESLSGVDVGAGLRRRLHDRAERLCFLNDADAFALGEYRAGAARGHDRVVCLTLGTGIGSSFLRGGRPVHDGPDVPPAGHVHRLEIDGRPLEETVSRRALRLGHARLAAPHRDPEQESALPDVHEIAVLAGQGDTAASEAFRYAFDALGRALAPWIDRFEATAVVVGGSMAQSWDLVHPAFVRGLAQTDTAPVRVLPARQPASAPLIGAAHWVHGAAGAS
ncbi:ROK family protein [Streptomyces apricus]|uniref:ROK family protein n=1 Tax=Streptomyces apricus TaxID=1828112 RepID=A0A5B0AIP4_9ACTN|nr:ROK family protein [Streptomyces apricus]KAA0929853.1 ROK family protein [Streptomyces apricus]